MVGGWLLQLCSYANSNNVEYGGRKIKNAGLVIIILRTYITNDIVMVKIIFRRKKLFFILCA